jgi:hypothetical protein
MASPGLEQNEPQGVPSRNFAGRVLAELPEGLALRLAEDEFAGTRKKLLKHVVLRAQLLRVALRGVTAKEAAKIVGCGYWVARSVYADDDFRRIVLSKVEGALAYADEKFQGQQKSLHERLAEKSERAFDVLCEMLEDPSTNAGLRFRVATSFLDRNPETAPNKNVAVEHNHSFSSEELRRAADGSEGLAD